MNRMGCVLGGVLVVLLVAACSRTASPVADVPRAVKLERFGASAAAGLQLPAQVRQAQRAELAFESGGRIAELLVDVGDRVQRGQVLARLDPEPLQLRAQQADASVRAALAQVGERQLQLRQQQAMFADGAASQASLTAAQAAADAAQAQLRSAQADLALARRAGRLGELRAPFDGSVVARLQQPQAEVAAGQPVLQLDGQGQLQLLANLPADTAATLTSGQTLQGTLEGATAGAVSLRVRSVATRLDNGATVPAILDIVSANAASPRSGDSVLLQLPAPSGAALPSVPLTAVLPRLNRRNASVFVYQAARGVVVERAVELGAIAGERIQILRGLKAGEQVVCAGVGFLSDGQAATPFQTQTRLSGARLP
ncbi:efflux RND transporter periplasmic adaptor subunit [Xanthomonas maliensis]|uniref:efflux RND transporter periplasmic adaptor subunit n=1 Tax=Xanthomonas maliensis TaxID=1321368 RepID=UPI0004CE5BE2|nr:efflux RND transporter periplasmic adaptor subunit [Xanthomonas maliensis]KAB7770099.1 efflux RND transporter periplasmic adaptor subunit [Xanthomonas maliensis]